MGIDVRGGTGGFGVGLDEVEAASRVLGAVAQEVAAAATRVALGALDPHLVASQVVSPGTGACAEAALARACGPFGLAGQAAALGALGVAAQEAVVAYQEGERAVAASAALAQDAVMYSVGSHAPEVAVGVLTLSALGLDVGALLDHAAFEIPEVSDLGGGTQGLLLGLAHDPLTRPVVALAAAGRLGPQGDLGSGPVGCEAEALRVLADAGSLAGVLRDGGVADLTAEAPARSGGRAPTGIAALGVLTTDVRYGVPAGT